MFSHVNKGHDHTKLALECCSCGVLNDRECNAMITPSVTGCNDG